MKCAFKASFFRPSKFPEPAPNFSERRGVGPSFSFCAKTHIAIRLWKPVAAPFLAIHSRRTFGGRNANVAFSGAFANVGLSAMDWLSGDYGGGQYLLSGQITCRENQNGEA